MIALLVFTAINSSLVIDQRVNATPQRYQGDNSATVIFTSRQETMDGACTPKKPGLALACTLQKKTIIMPNPCLWPGNEYAKLLCHEMGHVNGWSGDHEK